MNSLVHFWYGQSAEMTCLLNNYMEWPLMKVIILITFVAITYGKVSLWLWKSLENSGNIFLRFCGQRENDNVSLVFGRKLIHRSRKMAMYLACLFARCSVQRISQCCREVRCDEWRHERRNTSTVEGLLCAVHVTDAWNSAVGCRWWHRLQLSVTLWHRMWQ